MCLQLLDKTLVRCANLWGVCYKERLFPILLCSKLVLVKLKKKDFKSNIGAMCKLMGCGKNRARFKYCDTFSFVY